ncbi:probable FBD-associated F-box protein At1g32375 [Miscanthus floridulus]|uniref:probable FBD-associated F-box protein At1g32375 n=1 Tax=Miscanthus floridulus TaxID=154761 RepID=UPI00345B1EC7
MAPKTTKRWAPVNGNAGASRGRDGGGPDANRLSALPVAPPPLHQRLLPATSTMRYRRWVPATSTMRWVPVNRAGGASSSRWREGGDPDADRLSALPDVLLLHHIMSFLKAWEVVRTCVLSRRWRHLWASVPCVDLRVGQDDYDGVPEDFPNFVRRLFRRRDEKAALDTLRLRWSNVDGVHDEDDARLWIRTAIKRGARVIHLVGHRKGAWLCGGRLATLEHSSFVSCHLKILKLSYALLDDSILRQLSCHCSSLEELDLKDCVITGHEISSASLKILTMFKCQNNANLSIAALNLVLLRCISPITQAPSFQNMGSLVAGTIILDGYAFSDDFEDFSKDELAETTDEDDDNQKYKAGYGFGAPLEGFALGYKYDY